MVDENSKPEKSLIVSSNLDVEGIPTRKQELEELSSFTNVAARGIVAGGGSEPIIDNKTIHSNYVNIKENQSSLSEGGPNMDNTNALLRQELRDDMRADRKEFKDEIREQKQIFDNQLTAYTEDARAREERIEGKFNSVMDEMRSQRSDANSRFNVLDGKVDSVRTELINEFKSSKRWIIGTTITAFTGILAVIVTILTIIL